MRRLIKRQSPHGHPRRDPADDGAARLDRRCCPSITVPTLVVVGDDDVLTPPADSEAIAAALPNASLVRIAGAGHLSNLEQPRAFEASVEAFLAGLGPR